MILAATIVLLFFSIVLISSGQSGSANKSTPLQNTGTGAIQPDGKTDRAQKATKSPHQVKRVFLPNIPRSGQKMLVNIVGSDDADFEISLDSGPWQFIKGGKPYEVFRF